MVRLKDLFVLHAIPDYLGFNSKMVRLKDFKINTNDIQGFSFNSKMVRLKEDNLEKKGKVAPVFQFQNGTIKSIL